MKAHKRIQINVELKRFKFAKQFRKVSDMALPLFWADEVNFIFKKDFISFCVYLYLF